MRNILSFILLFLTTTQTFAICPIFDHSNCPTTRCEQGKFMGDDGECYSCYTTKQVNIDCIDDIVKICPNRFINPGCRSKSILNCFDFSIFSFFLPYKSLDEKEINFEKHICYDKYPAARWL